MCDGVVKYFGHEHQRQALERELPPVALLRGPASVGKWTLGIYLSEHHKLSSGDLRFHEKLSTDDARDLRQFALTAPIGRHKLVVSRLDGASESALNALLKLLEEPGRKISFLLTTTRPTLPTIESRSHVMDMGLLNIGDVYGVLTDRLGLDRDLANRAALASNGQIAAALASIEDEPSKALVLSALKALADGDEQLLKAVVTGGSGDRLRWDESASCLLDRWVVEALTGRWQVFTESESFGLSADRALLRRLLLGLRTRARPRLSMYAALQPLVNARSRQ